MPSANETLLGDGGHQEASDNVTRAQVDFNLETHDSAPASQIPASQNPIASPPPLQPAERLASLRGPGRFVESHNPMSPDSPVKKLKVQPKSSLRRSKEEREAAEKAEAERLHARFGTGVGSSSNISGRGDIGGRGGIRNTYGGASNRWHGERFSGSGASGFLGGATPAEDKRQRESLSTRSRGGGRSSTLSGTSRTNTEADAGVKVKKEAGARKGKSRDGNDGAVKGDSGRRKSTRVKTESENLPIEESDDEYMGLESAGKRIDIDQINEIVNLESSDEATATGDEAKGKVKASTPRPTNSSFMRPIRLARHEHTQRSIGVNTDPSSVTSAELRKQAKARGDAEASLFLPEDVDLRDDRVIKTKKKARPRDVEFIKNERKWQGVYQDEEDEDPPVKIKVEPKEQDDPILNVREELPGTIASQDMLTQGVPATFEDGAARTSHESTTGSAPDPRLDRKPKIRRPKALANRRPVLQTDEDREEWDRLKSDAVRIRTELIMPEPDSQQTETIANAKGNENVEETRTEEATKDRKEGLVYLFQLPPTMPSIEVPPTRRIRRQSHAQKTDSEDQQEPSTTAAVTKDSPATTKDTKAAKSKPNTDVKTVTTASNDPKIKTEPDADSKALTTTKKHPGHAIPPTLSPLSPHGSLGHVVLNAEGHPSATWSTDFRLNVGKASDYGALQEVVMVRSEKVELAIKERRRARVKREEGAKEVGTKCGEETWAVGQMGGGFVMTPDWGWMLGD